MKKTILVAMCVGWLVGLAGAELSLNGLFTDHMVLQRGQEVPVWGVAEPGAKITLEFAGQKKMATAKPDGSWRTRLDPMTASSKARSLTVRSSIKSEQLVLKNILVGDVWVLTGQSNMAREFRTYAWLMEELPSLETDEHIRWFKIKSDTTSDEPTKEIVIDPAFKGSWRESSLDLLPVFSPAGHFFGIHRYKQNGVPLGLMYAARGATMANSWVPRSVLESRPEYALFLDPEKNNNYKPKNGKPNPLRPVALYNGTIHPLIPFGIKGVLWYQGESDSRYADVYRRLFPDLIRNWRASWGQGDFPFVFAQLSSNKDRNWSAAFEPKESSWAWLREAQTFALDEPNTSMIVAYDLGEWEDIHPQNKEEVGRRFALAVAAMEGETVIARGPAYKGHEIRKRRMLLSFDNARGELRANEVRMNKNKGLAPGSDSEAFVLPADQLSGFIVCGPDRVFHEATAVLGPNGNTVIVESPEVAEPVAARYAWATFALANLSDQSGLPALPFRTDDFPMPALTAKKKPKKTAE